MQLPVTGSGYFVLLEIIVDAPVQCPKEFSIVNPGEI